MLNVPNVFTQGAMKALVQAQISAASMGHEKMGSGHLLCGLCRVGDELTRCILGDLTAGEIEEEVLRRCGRGEVGFSRVTGLTPHAQRALLRAVTYANPEKKILAGIAHIWQELLYEDGCTALIVLDSLGRTVDAMRTVLFNTVGEIERPLQATRIAASVRADFPTGSRLCTAGCESARAKRRRQNGGRSARSLCEKPDAGGCPPRTRTVDRPRGGA